MAKSTLPQYLTVALENDRRAQLATIAAIIVYAYAEEKADRETADLGARLHKQAPHKSEKTWQNHVSAARAVIVNKGQMIDGAYTDNTPEEAQAVVTDFLTRELQKGKYTASVDDIANWAKGQPSVKAKARAAEKAQAEALKLQQQANKEGGTTTATEEQKAAEAAKASATPAAQSQEEGQGDEAPAPEKRLLTVLQAADGSMIVEYGDSVDRETLINIALAIEEALQDPAFKATPVTAPAEPALV